jgi:hypothetical protein
MKIFEKLTFVFVFIAIQALNVPLWAIDVHAIPGKYECNLPGAVHDYQGVFDTSKELPKGSTCTYHISTLRHIPGADTNIDDILFTWIDLEDDKDSSENKKTAKAVKYQGKITTSNYPTNITTHKLPLFLLASSFLL